ncbi:MAG: flagellar basal body L-ring protein FlgH [Aminobacterium sp.]|jgi:flagellar L-ring protein precursor FlgH|uniref:flagellar basal body L-ring protein FlgH n=1 Tax=unclassified Aminobacterium TaxID=2685012 RepID=UPI001BCC4223|nr:MULTISPECIES: flagellar basal body L-ring protein FlgH [unclassified Aminobacterium]MDD2207376.1 flagellar basal body L-ring protein FlgH [Aminobacterium sp.]MDD3426010.1 flagellar basal body L-ring protein FlgH [Aminobacterium sp.]MDD4229445.1 flagellar basal body L-ring protein FlgH [Aminobacterium sp.]MDD4552101.1 flagellar basal body L-ring protein FlgH [Aminobacterium sp.]MEA4878057.1 flagellar basal body L-ring protein FlgH [Aminobacterium sp.]
MNVKRTLIVLSVFVFIFSGWRVPLLAQSLWSDSTNWIADQRPSQIGDIVSVVVAEKTTTKDEAKTDVSKDNNNSVSDGVGVLNFIKALGFSSKSSTKGDSSTERTHTAKTTITCLVTEVLPNGNLVIEGARDVVTHEEKLKLHIRGVIRPQDVESNNTIGSDKVANAEIGVEGRGALSRVQKPGILTQILQAIF